MGEVCIRHGLFRYHHPETQIVGGEEKKVLVERMAFHNEIVDIPREADIERGESMGAFWSVEQAREHYAMIGVPAPGLGAPAPVEEVVVEQEVDLADLPDDELVDWIMSTGRFDGQPTPTVAQVVEASDGDPAMATRLEEAEKRASGDAPRAGVIQGLEKVKEGA